MVRAYITALDSHDIPKARALLTPAHAQDVDREVDSWFTNVVSIKHLRTNRPYNDVFDARQRHYRSCVGLGVRFDLEQHEALSMPNGTTTWGYILCRNSSSKPWRIADEGTG